MRNTESEMLLHIKRLLYVSGVIGITLARPMSLSDKILANLERT